MQVFEEKNILSSFLVNKLVLCVSPDDGWFVLSSTRE